MQKQEEWEARVRAAWDAFDGLGEQEFLDRMESLAAEGPEAEGLFERASAFDSTGHEQEAVDLYERALAAGLGEDRRRQAVIQLASSLRNVGRLDEAVTLLEAEAARPSDELDDAVHAFLALALTSAGREREAVSILLTALAPHLPRYTRSVTAYAEDLLTAERRSDGSVGGR